MLFLVCYITHKKKRKISEIDDTNNKDLEK